MLLDRVNKEGCERAEARSGWRLEIIQGLVSNLKDSGFYSEGISEEAPGAFWQRVTKLLQHFQVLLFKQNRCLTRVAVPAFASAQPSAAAWQAGSPVPNQDQTHAPTVESTGP